MEKKVKDSIFITTPIYYVNSKPHIGSVYTTIMADIINRFNKLNSKKTFFLTGTDEHGMKIQQSAEKNKENEQEFVDKISKIFQGSADFLNCKYDDFIRTTEIRHKKFVQDIWKILVDKDWLYRGKYTGWYCVSDEAYYMEDELIKDEDGNFKTELGKAVEWKEEDSYFFRLSEFQDILLNIYIKNDDFIQPESRKNEIISFVGGGDLKNIMQGNYNRGYLKDLSISRNNFTWGIKISCDENKKSIIKNIDEWVDNLDNKEKHVVYVWLDALFNYKSSIQKNPNLWENSDVVHLVGKDIIKFHTIYWPAFLIAVKYSREEFKKINFNDILNSNILPKTVFAHGWWTNEGKKISKSFGNIINPYDEIEWLQKEFVINKETAVDYFRYYLSTEGTFGSDLDYSRTRLVEKINSELVNNIGNLIQRVLSMIYKNFNGSIKNIDQTSLNSFDKQNLNSVDNLENLLKNDTLNKFDFTSYKNIILQLSNTANDYMEKTAPWNLKKENKIEEMKKVLYLQSKIIFKIIVLLKPICPYISDKVLNFLNIKNTNYNIINDYILETNITEPQGFFPRLVNNSKN